MSTQILKGLRVLDLTRMLSGPYCTMHLADHGAEVIKIEAGNGDTSRGNGPFHDDDTSHKWAGYFVSLNRGKKSIQLDLKSQKGNESFLKLAATADVIVENFRPGVMERLGLSYETLATNNKKLVYAAIRGFGDPRSGASPYAKWPSFDVVAQAMGGLMSMTGPNAETPTKTGPGVGDIFAGMMMAFGIMAALREAEATGKGQFVDVAMYDAMISLCERMVYLHDITGNVPKPEGNGHPLLAPFGLFPTQDGHVALGIVDDAFWRKLCQLMSQPELGTDTRFKTLSARSQNSVELNKIVSTWSCAHTKDQLTKLLGGKVPYGPLNTIEDIERDPHVAIREMLAKVPNPNPGQKPWIVAANPLRFGAHPHQALSAPPALGADENLLEKLLPNKKIIPETEQALISAFRSFSTGVAVVTTRQKNNSPMGITTHSLTTVSINPPLLLICISKASQSFETFLKADHFVINVLTDEQKEISDFFSSQSDKRFNLTDCDVNSQNIPVLKGSLASFSCVKYRLVNAGDNLILIGRVTDFEVNPGTPLGHYRGENFSIDVENSINRKHKYKI